MTALEPAMNEEREPRLRTADRPGLFSLMAEDVRAALERDPAARGAAEVIFSYAGVHAIWAHRLEHWLWARHLYWLARVCAQVSRFMTGIEIHPGAQLGRRLFIDHGMGVVIGETAEIGNDVTIYHGVTLGGVSLEKTKRHPTLEDDVVVGAGAKILGNITIGSHSRIGANAVVVKPVPPQSVVVGVPGQIIRRRHETPGAAADLSHTDIPDAITDSLIDLMYRMAEVEAKLGLPGEAHEHLRREENGVWQYDDQADYSI